MQNGNSFFKLTNYARNQPISQEKFAKCGWEKSKLNIRNGKIFNCPSVEFVDVFNAHFDENLNVDSKDFLWVDDTLTREKIDAFKSATPFCAQCNPDSRYTRPFKNLPSRGEKSEWSSL